jgi:hypothetical protein
MTRPDVEYVGFKVTGAGREYTFRVRLASGDELDFVLAIPNDAFESRRVRYQDAPDICFLKLHRELAAHNVSLPEAYMRVSDAELEEFGAASATRPPRGRTKAPSTG